MRDDDAVPVEGRRRAAPHARGERLERDERLSIAGLPCGTDRTLFSASWLHHDLHNRSCLDIVPSQQAEARRGLCEMPASPNIRLSAMSQSQ